MADKKITQLTDLGTALASDTLFNVVANPSVTPINNKVSAANIFNNIPTFIATKDTADTLSATGAASVTSSVTLLNATSGILTATLANGVDGQRKTFINVSTGGSYAATITPASFNGYTSAILTGAGKTVTLMYKNSKWNIISGNGYTTA